MKANSITSQSTAVAALGYEDFVRQYAERYQMVLFTFRRNSRPQVKEIWRSMLDRDSGQYDKALAEQIGIPMNTIVIIRHRIRQRLEVFRFFDEPSDSLPDLPGNFSVLDWVEAHWGIDQEAIPTLQKLATLARAAQGEKTLGWALLARACTDTEQDRAEISDTARTIIKRAGGQPPDVQRRLITYRAWTERQWHKQKISELRDLTKANKVSFLLAPCWYLTKLREQPLENILTILNPAAREKSLIEQIIGRLQ